jgi:hypothetical protein
LRSGVPAIKLTRAKDVKERPGGRWQAAPIRYGGERSLGAFDTKQEAALPRIRQGSKAVRGVGAEL